jgi:formylglycine-generating enzyme required for sulfatase activity
MGEDRGRTLGKTARAVAVLALATFACPAGGAAAPSGAAAECARYDGLPPPTEGTPAGMVWIKGGAFAMGSETHGREEAPVRRVSVNGFWIDRHPVTNAQFARFVAATGYVTVAERSIPPGRHPDLPDALRVPGAAVFVMPARDAPRGASPWWRFVPGADWRHPAGPGTSVERAASHPVVDVAYEDALAYARWAGRDLPTEAEWEYAARGGREGSDYVWGDELHPGGKWMANTWQGAFPFDNTGEDGFLGTSPVGCFPPNGYGLSDMAGNVWQWTSDWYRPGHEAGDERDPRGPASPAALPRHQAARVIKGGSFLCSPDFCARYRPSARQPAEEDLGTSHIGFRTVLRAGDKP